MKKQFNIEVIRTGFGFKTIMVEAENLREAEDKALEEAGDHEYSEKSSEYDIAGFSDKKLEKIYHEIDSECISETNMVTMDTVREILKKHGANEENMF